MRILILTKWIALEKQALKKLASRALSILCPQVSKKKKKKLRELRYRWFTRLKLIVLVCFRTTMDLCGFNSVAALDLVTIEFRVKMPLQNCVQWNEHCPHLSGLLSATFDHYRWLLRPALNLHVYLPFLGTGAIVNGYMPLSKWILLPSFGGTFGNFRPLSLTTSTCVSLHRTLWVPLLRKRAIANLWTLKC